MRMKTEMTEREDKILDFLSLGLSYREISKKLNYDPGNLSRNIKVIGRKLGIVGKVTRQSIQYKIMHWRIE